MSDWQPEYRIIGRDANLKPLAHHMRCLRPWATREKEPVAIMPFSREDIVITPLRYGKVKVRVGDSIEVEVEAGTLAHWAQIALQHSLRMKP